MPCGFTSRGEGEEGLQDTKLFRGELNLFSLIKINI